MNSYWKPYNCFNPTRVDMPLNKPTPQLILTCKYSNKFVFMF